MFTGIIEEVGKLRELNGSNLTVECSKVLKDTQIGDSISINGCCQTVVSMTSDSFTVNVSDETFRISNFKYMKAGDSLNLERALMPSSRLGGHIVQGHVDCVGKYLGNMTFSVEDTKYIVYKGSITVNGISLTVADLKEDRFSVAVIPHTFDNTNLRDLRIGDFVNIETDILGRYVEKFLSAGNNSKITENFLAENGFM